MGKTYTVKQVAALLGFSTNTVYKYLDEKRIRATRLGTEGRFRIPQSEIDRLLGEKNRSTSGYLPNETAAPVDAPTVSQSSAVSVSPLIPEENPSQSDNPLSFRTPRIPSFFNWFIGILGIFNGVASLLFPLVPLSLASAQGMIDAASSISLIVAGLILIGVDFLVPEKSNKLRLLISVMGMVIFGVRGIYLVIEIEYLRSLGAFVISLMFFLQLFVYIRDSVRFIIMLNVMAIAAGVMFTLRPQEISVPFMQQFVISSPQTFLIIWSILSAITTILSVIGITRGGMFLYLPFGGIIVYSLVYGVFSSANGDWDTAIYNIIIAAFCAIFPFWNRISAYSQFNRQRLTAGFMAFIGIVILGITTMFFMQRYFVSHIQHEQEDILQTHALLLETTLTQGRAALLQSSTRLRVIESLTMPRGSNLADEQTKQIYAANPVMRRILIADREGTIIGAYPSSDAFKGTKLLQPEAAQMARQTGGVVLSPAFAHANGAATAVAIAGYAPIFSEDGVFLGSLIGSYDMQRMKEILGRGVGDWRLRTADPNGSLYIDTKQMSETIQKVTPGSFLEMAVAGQSGVGNERDEDGDIVMGVYMPIDGYGGVMLSRPYDEILSQYSVVLFSIFLIVMTAGIITLMVTVYSRQKL
jgi:excisionase family DNA binding protein